MSTMDIIKLYGGEPANFLDVGGSADGDQMTEAMKLLNDDESVKAVFINIFGGILKCDVLTGSILKAADVVGLKKPIVLRLKGTNADIAKKMLEGKQEKLGIYYEEDFDTAAQKVCQIVKWGASFGEIHEKIETKANIDLGYLKQLMNES